MTAAGGWQGVGSGMCRGKGLLSVWLAGWTASLLAALLALAACGAAASPAVPTAAGGTYTSRPYHFSITYPAGWQVTVSQQSSTIVPLTLVITRVHANAAEGAAVSTFTITVFDAHNAAIATGVKALASDKTLSPVTLAGLSAYRGTAIQQPAQGSGEGGSQVDDTHTDYYVPTATYEYQLSTDAITGDHSDAAFQTMLASFTVTK